MTGASTFDGLLKLVLMVATSGTPARRRTVSGMALEILVFSCFVAAMVLALVAIGLAIAPRLGAAVAVAVDSAAIALIGLILFAWTRRRPRTRASAPLGPTLEAMVAKICEHLEQEKGLSIIAGLLVGLLAGGSRR